MTTCTPAEAGWCVDKRVNVSTLMAVASSLVVAVSLVVGLNMRLGVAEEKLVKVEDRVEQMRETVIKVERIEERIVGLRLILLEIKEDLKARRGV